MKLWSEGDRNWNYSSRTKQESLANAKVNVWQHCVSLSCLRNSLIQIEWVADLSQLQQFQVIQGHPFPCKCHIGVGE